MANPAEVEGILEAGADRLRPEAEATMAEAREKMGLRKASSAVVALTQVAAKSRGLP
jgi:hypothetical protein